MQHIMRNSAKGYLPMLFVAGLVLMACGNSNRHATETGKEKNMTEIRVPTFNADSAYTYIEKQVSFGPRVPNTKAHQQCGDYLIAQLETFGAKVYSQQADLMAYNGTILKSRNIIGVYNPETKKRVLLCAHWDSRPYADADESRNFHTPIDGANDGASGVGVLLEIARNIQQQAPAIGIDIVFFDAEDYGIPEFYNEDYKPDTWCLGSQYWGRIPHVANYKARFGILLDMVGGKDATFYYEGYSKRTASQVMQKIWDTAHQLGYAKYFIKNEGGEVVDDHVYINSFRQIPCVDIIDHNPNTDTGFNDTWHTLNDNIDHIDRQTLKAVGQTVLTVIYNEK